MAPALTAVTDRVHMAETPLVNWTVVVDGAGVMLIDAGYPGQRQDVLASLRALGFGPEDVAAILLTHAHVDHLGTAIWFAAHHHTPVYCHASELGHARRQYLDQVSPAALAARMWRPRWLAWSARVAATGGLIRAGIPTAAALTPTVAARLPGRPVPLPTPGHTDGHCSYVVDGVLIAGDALVTGHPLLPERGPQLLPSVFNHNQTQCAASLRVLGGSDARALIPGHGPLWTGSMPDVARLAASPSP